MLLDYREILIFGDSLILIISLIHDHAMHNVNLNSLLERIQTLLPKFDFVKFSHNLRNLNEDASQAANQGANLPAEILNTTAWGIEMQSMS